MKKLSIIVPIFNVEKYIDKCLDSLLAQNFSPQEYEIIIVNDGSTDKSEAIAKIYLEKHKHISLINQKNQGLGGARNTGINHATGKYLMFVDSDDYIAENKLSVILKRADLLNLDILRFNHQEVDENYTFIAKKKNARHAVVFKEDIIDGQEYLAERLGWACYVPIYLFKTSFIKSRDLKFKKEIYYEDVEWLPRVLAKAQRVSSVDSNVYYYMQRKGSITKANLLQKKNKVLDDKLLMIAHLLLLSMHTKNYNVIKWVEGMIALAVIRILSYSAQYLPDRKKELISKMKIMGIFPLKKNVRFTFKQKLHISLINFSMEFYFFLKRSNSKFILNSF